MDQQNQKIPTFTTQLSDPHFGLSAHTFAMHTLPFDNISFALDLLLHDEAATQNLLALDWINQTIVGLEWQLDENHRLAAQQFSSLLRWQAAQHFPQWLHDHLHPDCGRCRLRRRIPTPFSSPAPSSSSSSSPSSLSARHYQQRPSPRTRPLPSLPSSLTATLPLPPLTTRSGWVYPQNYVLQSECCRLPLPSSNDPGRTTVGDCSIPHRCRSPWSGRRHLPTILPMVHQRGTRLDVRCTSGVMGGNVTVWSVVSFPSFHFRFTRTFHYSLFLFHLMNCALLVTYVFPFLYLRLCTSPNHHVQPWWFHPVSYPCTL